MSTVLVLNGPNLNLLGTREPGIYGAQTLEDVEHLCQEEAGRLGLKLDFRQSNHEGQLIDWIHEAGRDHAAGRGVAGYPLAIRGLYEVLRPPSRSSRPRSGKGPLREIHR